MRAVPVPVTLFLERGWPYLLGEPVLNNLMLTVTRGHRTGGGRWWLVTDDGGAVVGAAVHGGPGLILAGARRAVAEALADAVRDHPVPQVTGTDDLAGWFNDRYGATVSERMPSRVYALGRVVPPRGVPGRARQAVSGDRGQLLRWVDAFAAEALSGEPRSDPAGPIDDRLGDDGLLWVWEDGGRPVAMTMVTRPVAGVVRISGVYTPPDRRGRGYASGCVAAASEYALGTVAHTCALYTDLRNPTSNRIYAALGYRPVADVTTWRYAPG